MGESVLLADLFRSHLFKPSGVLGAVHVHTFGDELAVVLIRRSHQHLKPLLLRQGGYRADHIVRLKTRTLQAGDMHGVEQVFDDGHGTAYILGRLFALRLVGGIRLVTERRTGRIKRHGNVRGIGLLHEIIQRNHKAEDSGRVLATEKQCVSAGSPLPTAGHRGQRAGGFDTAALRPLNHHVCPRTVSDSEGRT